MAKNYPNRLTICTLMLFVALCAFWSWRGNPTLAAPLFEDPSVPPTTVTITPDIPHITESVQVTVAGRWHEGCVPKYKAHQQANQRIMIETITLRMITPEIVCAQAETPWSFTVDLGQLAAGPHEVEVSGAVTTSTTFSVMEYAVYLPLIDR